MKLRAIHAPLLVVSSMLAAHATPSIPPEIAVETLFQTSGLTGLEFSPNGKAILCLVPYEGRQNLAVIDLEKGRKDLLSNFKDKQAINPIWASDERILFFVDDDGRERFQLYAVNRDGSDPSNLVSGKQMRLLRRMDDNPKAILVEAGITHADWPDVAEMSLKTGRLSPPIAKAPGNVAYYVLDHQNVVRVAVTEDEQTQMRSVLYRDKNREEWQLIASHQVDLEGWEPVEFDGDNRTLFVWSNIGRKTRAVYRYDTETKVMGELVHGDETYDVDSVVFDESKNMVVGIHYHGDRRRFFWIDAEMARIHKSMEQALPDTVHSPVQFAKDGSKIIFYSYSDRDPGVYYLYDRKRTQASELAVVSPAIDPGQMAPMVPIHFQARDGVRINGYLTLPVGREPSGLPLVVHPHGGPYGVRDTWRFNPEVQFYANRGYAVVQVDYRGSSGYGFEFEAAGFKRWGLQMQDDLTDAAGWAVREGLADSKRIVISGASYGGYAAMAGLVFTPELYCAGINYAGPVNIGDLIPRGAGARGMYWMNTRIGNMNKSDDRKRIHDTSPVHFADRIRAPLLMAYGKNDPRVPIHQAYDIERALKGVGSPYELIIEGDEGHGFRMEEKRISFYRRIDAFLKQHVPAGDRRDKVVPPREMERPGVDGA